MTTSVIDSFDPTSLCPKGATADSATAEVAISDIHIELKPVALGGPCLVLVETASGASLVSQFVEPGILLAADSDSIASPSLAYDDEDEDDDDFEDEDDDFEDEDEDEDLDDDFDDEEEDDDFDDDEDDDFDDDE